MFLLSNQATAPAGGAAGALAREIGQLRLTLRQAQSSGQQCEARMVELDLFGLIQELISMIGIDQATVLVGEIEDG